MCIVYVPSYIGFLIVSSVFGCQGQLGPRDDGERGDVPYSEYHTISTAVWSLEQSKAV